MSTASRNRGMDGGARARDRNAVSAPGVNGKLREHYDSRALVVQLGGPDERMRPKRMPEAENAATGDRAQAPTTTPGLREPRLRHSPPPKPARPPPEEAARTFGFGFKPRETPLERCPDLTCHRSKRCRREGSGKPCQKLYETQDETRLRLIGTLKALRGDGPKLRFSNPEDEQAHVAKLYKTLLAKAGRE